jgi:ferritin-like metal-binding protein YciE
VSKLPYSLTALSQSIISFNFKDMAKSKSLRELLGTKIQALYDIENELIQALPTMAEAATDSDLKEAFETHLEETKSQAEKLENIFDLLGEDKEKQKSEAIRGLVKDSEWLVKNVEEGDALDTALIAAARSVEHYEMSKYMAAQEWAEMLGQEEVSALLTEIFEEEEATDEKLSELGTLIAERANNDEDEEEKE